MDHDEETYQPEAGSMQQRIDAFLKSHVENKRLDGRTEKAYRGDLEQLARWLGMQKAEEPLDGALLQIYLEQLVHQKQVKRSTIVRKYYVLRIFQQYMVELGEMTEHGLHMPELPQTQGTDAPTLSKKEVDELFRGIERYQASIETEFQRDICLRDKTMLKLLFYHGLDVSTIRLLQMDAYNREENLLYLKRKKQEIQVARIFAQDLQRDLNAWIDVRDKFQLDPEYEDYLFLSKLGRPISMQGMLKMFSKYRELTGIRESVTLKTLKRSMQQYAKDMMLEQLARKSEPASWQVRGRGGASKKKSVVETA